MGRSVHSIRILVAVAWFLANASCGYQFSGKAEGLLKDIQTLYVEPFVHKGKEVGLEWDMTMALKSEFYHDGHPRIVNRVEEADAVLSGVVRALETRVLATNQHDEVLVYEATLIVDLNLRRRSPDKLIWRGQQMRLTDSYSGSRGAVVITSPDFKTGNLNANDVAQFSDIQFTESMAKNMRERLVRTFAQQLHQKLVDSF
jgi:Lipopolysaccharide-assembly